MIGLPGPLERAACDAAAESLRLPLPDRPAALLAVVEDLERARAFVADVRAVAIAQLVVDAGSLSAVAVALGLSKAAVQKAVDRARRATPPTHGTVVAVLHGGPCDGQQEAIPAPPPVLLRVLLDPRDLSASLVYGPPRPPTPLEYRLEVDAGGLASYRYEGPR